MLGTLGQDKPLLLDELGVKLLTSKRGTKPAEYVSVSKSGKQPDTHDCRKNHTGTSKSMEAGAAAEIYEHVKACCIRCSTFIGDEDSTTIA